MKSKYIVPIVILVLLVVVVVVAKMTQKTVAPTVSNQPGNVATITPPTDLSQIKVDTIAPATVPTGLPVGLPFETGATILQNFEIKDPTTGKTQSTRVYVSKKTLADSFAIYQKYLKDNGWTITSSIDQAGIKNLAATKGSARLDITIAADSKGKNTVNVSYVN